MDFFNNWRTLSVIFVLQAAIRKDARQLGKITTKGVRGGSVSTKKFDFDFANWITKRAYTVLCFPVHQDTIKADRKGQECSTGLD